MAYRRIRVPNTAIKDAHTPGHVSRHDIALGLVKDGIRNARVGRAQCFPVPEYRVLQ